MNGPQPGTPTPWAVSDGAGRVFINGPRCFVCAMDTPSVQVQSANAAAIVHRVNNWDALEAERDALQARVDGLVEAGDVLGEAFFHLSDKLRGSGFLSDDANHAEYERVVAAFEALSQGERS